MKKVIPFTKEIVFNTDIYEINSISLEHNLKINSDNTITGEFIISGDYKENEIVINNEPFIYNIPVNIDLDCKYDTSKVKLEIDDFNYETINSNKLVINIILNINGIEEIENITSEEPIIDIVEEVKVESNTENIIDKIEDEKDNVIDERNIEETMSIFNNFDEKDDVYVTYKVHIFRENDSIENIMKLYNISKEELDEYNDLSSITLGSKIIIPNNEI